MSEVGLEASKNLIQPSNLPVGLDLHLIIKLVVTKYSVAEFQKEVIA